MHLKHTPTGEKFQWTIRDAFEGVQVFGATGSGKSSGSGRALALGLLRAGFGGLVLTAKPSDAGDWADLTKGYMVQAGRSDRPIVVGPESRWDLYRRWGVDVPEGGHRLNFLDYEYRRLHRAGLNPCFNLVALFEAALEAGRPEEASGSGEPFWQDTFRQLLQHAIDLSAMADDSVDLSRIKEIVLSAPTSRDEAASRAWRSARGACWESLENAQRRFDEHRPPRFYDQNDFRQTATYWLSDLAGLSWKTRSSILTTFTSRVDAMLRSPLRQIFCPDPHASPDGYTFPPECSHAGRVIVLDFPIKAFGETGRFVQILYKTLWQLATEDRLVDIDHERGLVTGQAPVFLWADESQYFVTSRDMLFQLTARSKAVSTVYLTQNLPNYYAMLKGSEARSAADSLVSSLQTKIFHANGDPVTNEWAERLFGRKLGLHRGGAYALQQQGVTATYHDAETTYVRASRFPRLKCGGPPDNRVESIIFHPRSIAIAPDHPFIEHAFEQSLAFGRTAP